MVGAFTKEIKLASSDKLSNVNIVKEEKFQKLLQRNVSGHGSWHHTAGPSSY